MKAGTSITIDGYSLYVDFVFTPGARGIVSSDPGDSRDAEPDLIEVEAVHITSPANITEIITAEFMDKLETAIREDPGLRGQ